MHSHIVGVDWGKEITEEATDCGCNEPSLHAVTNLHKASYEFNKALREPWQAIIDTPLTTFIRSLIP